MILPITDQDTCDLEDCGVQLARATAATHASRPHVPPRTIIPINMIVSYHALAASEDMLPQQSAKLQSHKISIIFTSTSPECMKSACCEVCKLGRTLGHSLVGVSQL
jgi:hypothetical protein